MPVLYGYNPITGTWGVLSEVMNGYPFATDDETTAGVIDSKAVTPSSLSPALALKANTADVNAALALKAPLLSPVFTGVPVAPTAAQGTNTTQLATCAHVFQAMMEGDWA